MSFLLGNWQRFVLYTGLAAVLLGASWFHGYTRGEMKLFKYQADELKAAVPVIVKQGATTEKIVIRWRTKTVEIAGKTETILKEIVRYVPPSADPVLPLGWVMLHDAAAGPVPPPAPGADVTAPAIASSQALKGVVGNYGTCYATAAKLIGLQEWVRQQFQVMNLEALGY